LNAELNQSKTVKSCHRHHHDGRLNEWTSAAQLLRSRTAFIRQVPVSPVHIRIYSIQTITL